MRYAGFMPNDFINGEGVCVSLWTQGCPFRCSGCHNPECWDFDGGYEVPIDIKGRIIKAISANGVIRNFSILGGEPLCEENREFVKDIVLSVRVAYPNIKIFLWTGYTIEQLQSEKDTILDIILSHVDVIIDGPYAEERRDTTLRLRGSSNQRIFTKEEL